MLSSAELGSIKPMSTSSLDSFISTDLSRWHSPERPLLSLRRRPKMLHSTARRRAKIIQYILLDLYLQRYRLKPTMGSWRFTHSIGACESEDQRSTPSIIATGVRR